MKFARHNLLWKSLVTLPILYLLLAHSVCWAQSSQMSAEEQREAAVEAFEEADEAFAEQVKAATGLPFPVYIAVLFLPPILGVFILCMGAQRRLRDKQELYKPTRLAETLGEDEKKSDQPRRPGRMAPQMSEDAKSALTLSIIGCFTLGILGLVGMLKGLSAKKKIAADRRLEGDGVALAAIIVGAGSMLMWVVIVIGILFAVL